MKSSSTSHEISNDRAVGFVEKEKTSTPRESALSLSLDANLLRIQTRHKRKSSDNWSHGKVIHKTFKIALVILWVMSITTSLICDVVVDVFQADYPLFPLVPVFITSIGMQCVGAIVVILLGLLTRRGFSVFQPFVGGQIFVVMQAIGYSLCVFSSVAKFMVAQALKLFLLSGSGMTTRYGVFGVLGIFSFGAQIILIASLLFFISPSVLRCPKPFLGENPEFQSLYQRTNILLNQDVTQSPTREYVFISLCCFIIVFCALTAENYREFQPVNVAFMVSFMAISMTIIRGYIAPRFAPTYQWITPYTSRAPVFFVVQFIGNILILITMIWCVLLYYTNADTPSSWHLGCALLAVVAISMHLLLLRLNKMKLFILRPQGPASPARTEAGVSAAFVQDAGDAAGQRVVRLYGPLMFSCISVFLSSAIYVIAFGNIIYRRGSSELIDLGFRRVQNLLVGLLFVLPIFTHFQGRIMFGSRFQVWQPFGGKLEFVMLQGGGWTAYGFAIFFATLHISDPPSRSNFLLLLTACLLFSQLILYVSLYVFCNNLRENTLKKPLGLSREEAGISSNDSLSSFNLPSGVGKEAFQELSPPVPRGSDKDVRFTLATVFNGELLLAIVLTIISLLIRIVCDIARYNQLHLAQIRLQIPVNTLVSVANLFSYVGAPIAQLSMRDHIPILNTRPINNSFTVLQTSGWLLYTIFVIYGIVEACGGVSRLLTYHSTYYFMKYVGEGLLLTIPLICGVLSNFIETQSIMKHRARLKLIKGAMDDIKRMLCVEKEASVEQECKVDRLLSIIVGRRGLGVYDLPTVLPNGERTVNAEDIASDAYFVTTIQCLLSVVLFICAAIFSNVHKFSTMIVFALIGMMVLIISCLSVHCVFGMRLHGSTGRYSFFMPFVGGRTFAIWQGVGWLCFTLCLCLILTCILDRKDSYFLFLVLCVMSPLAQCSLLHSLSFFDPHCDCNNALLRKNANGFLAVTTMLGSFFFAHLYNSVRVTSTEPHTISFVSMIIVSITTCIAVPMGLLFLQRQAQHYDFSTFQLLFNSNTAKRTGEINDPDEPTTVSQDLSAPESITSDSPYYSSHARSFSGVIEHPAAPQKPPRFILNSSNFHQTKRHAGRTLLRKQPYLRYGAPTLAVFYIISLVFAFFVVLLLPFTVMVWVYGYTNQAHTTFRAGVLAFESLLGLFLFLVLVPMVITPLTGYSSSLRNIHCALCCWSIYAIPSFTVLVGILISFTIPTGGSYVFSVNMIAMACFSTIPHVHLLSFLFSLFSCGYLAHYHLHICWYSKRAPFMTWKCVYDVAFTLLWVWYCPRYFKRASVTGAFRSQRVIKFLQRYFFDNIAHYFSLMVIVANDFILPLEKGMIDPSVCAANRVDRSNPRNHYLFSFHPHGVFPGTAIFAPLLKKWEKKVGCNDENFISIHAADVIFSVPFMCEFPLSLGAMSVGRLGIENSIKAGNSPLIVTGGQSEMLFTQVTKTEMHLVCHHMGFIKIAMRNRIPLVPILSFGENNIFSMLHCTRLQRWAIKHVGFPFPVIPFGRWWLPLAMSPQVTLVIGSPIYPLPGRDNPEDLACLEEMRLRYFEHVEVLFYRYRGIARYPDMKLFLHNGIDDESGALGDDVPPSSQSNQEYAETTFMIREGHSAVFKALYEMEKSGDGT